VTVEQHTVDTATRLTHLRDGLLDAAFVRLSRPPGGGLEFLLLQLDPLLVALPAMHPLAAREVIPLAALNNQPLAFYPRDQNPAWYDEVHHALAQAGAQMRTVREASDPMSNLPTVAAGQALTFLSAPLAQALRYADVTVRPLGPPRLAVGLGLAWRGGDTAGPVATLVRVARQHQTLSASSARPLPPPAARG
jgi:LysR family transcriptional regulator, benzoate and cis,cis-muconate-responsive activator of ben and cat genes